MTNSKRVERDQRKEAILKASAPLFANKGISVTTKELALAASVSEALIYKHFDSKEDLFKEVQGRCCGEVHPVADQVFLEPDPANRFVLGMTLLSYVILVGFDEELLPKSEVQKLVLRSLASDGEFAEQLFSNFDVWVPKISELMKENQKLGNLEVTDSSNEELLWMAHHFCLGMVAANLPKKEEVTMKISSLVKKITIHSLMMIGMKYQKANQLFDDNYKKFKKLEGVKNDD